MLEEATPWPEWIGPDAVAVLQAFGLVLHGALVARLHSTLAVQAAPPGI
jgi:hypothetical protein